jgi:hypothetical protein
VVEMSNEHEDEEKGGLEHLLQRSVEGRCALGLDLLAVVDESGCVGSICVEFLRSCVYR